jgi:hypothetical protein
MEISYEREKAGLGPGVYNSSRQEKEKWQAESTYPYKRPLLRIDSKFRMGVELSVPEMYLSPKCTPVYMLL